MTDWKRSKTGLMAMEASMQLGGTGQMSVGVGAPPGQGPLCTPGPTHLKCNTGLVMVGVRSSKGSIRMVKPEGKTKPRDSISPGHAKSISVAHRCLARGCGPSASRGQGEGACAPFPPGLSCQPTKARGRLGLLHGLPPPLASSCQGRACWLRSAALSSMADGNPDTARMREGGEELSYGAISPGRARSTPG